METVRDPAAVHLGSVVQLVQFGLNAVDRLFDFGRCSVCRVFSGSARFVVEVFIHGGLEILQLLRQPLDLFLQLPDFLPVLSSWKGRNGSSFQVSCSDTNRRNQTASTGTK